MFFKVLFRVLIILNLFNQCERKHDLSNERTLQLHFTAKILAESKSAEFRAAKSTGSFGSGSSGGLLRSKICSCNFSLSLSLSLSLSFFFFIAMNVQESNRQLGSINPRSITI